MLNERVEMSETRTALVTGAAGGIGSAVVETLAGKGWRVAALDLEGVLASVPSADSVRAFACDIADYSQVRQSVEAARAALGPIAALVNVAAIVDHLSPITRMKPERWEREIAVNLSAPFYFTRECLPDMIAARFGRIVHISSIAARCGLHLQAAYCASKAGLRGLMNATVAETASLGVTCNTILPGLIETPKVRALPAAVREPLTTAIPTRRLGQPSEIARAVAFLLEPEAGFINGAELDVDGAARLKVFDLSGRT
jgi:NAD(P)-dependent dehydrogenase (short-subunit alcohol dehydrogenase family)